MSGPLSKVRTVLKCPSCHEKAAYKHRARMHASDRHAPTPDVECCPHCAEPYTEPLWDLIEDTTVVEIYRP